MMSLLRPGRFLVCRALTRNTSRPCCCRISNTGIQYTPVDQPICHLLQIRRKTTEAADRLLVQFWIDGHPMFAAANVDAGCTRMYDLQSFPVSFQPVRLGLAVALCFLAHHFSYRWNRI